MTAVLCVGAGGFIGAVARYLLGLLPWEGDFPLVTFLVNFIGAVAIGAIVEVAECRLLAGAPLSENAVLFLKTGLCGGFTTFSTFSLETVALFEQEHYATSALYAGVSLVACVAGVIVGKVAARAFMSAGQAA